MMSQIRTHRSEPDASRRGSTYVAVMGVTLIVSMMGMAAMVTSRLEIRRVGQSQDLDHARCLAQSALEFGLANLEADPNWRSTYTNDVEAPSPALDFTLISNEQGTMTFKLVDEKDGNLADDASDPVRLYGIGRVGEADYVLSVLLEPTGAGLSCLEASLHSNGQIWMWNGVTVATDQLVSTNNSIWTNGSGVINGNAEAVGTIQSGSVAGTATTGISARQMPDSTQVFEYYLTNGTWIDYASLDSGPQGSRTIHEDVLSPASNPFGTGQTNPRGIYVIDCQGGDIRIQNSRIVGTLVLLNPGPASMTWQALNWEPAVPNFPALLCDGNIELAFDSTSLLDEQNGSSPNFNPPGTPYNGIEDSDALDTYPSLIKGLVYISGLLDIQNEGAIDGVVVTATINPQANMTLTYDPVFLYNPPPGFRAADADTPWKMQISPGSWQRAVSQ